MKKNKAEDLLNRYRTGVCSEEDDRIIDVWYADLRVSTDIPLRIEEVQEDLEEVFLSIRELSLPAKRNFNWRWLSIAAAILIIISVSIFTFWHLYHQADEYRSAAIVVPGTDRAMLKLSNGKEILLTALANGATFTENGTKITKTSSGQLVYDTRESNITARGIFNTISVPIGGQWQLILSDGTKVWLNSGTSLTYPAIFSKDERKVSLTGEAYFEVAHQKVPFHVETAEQEIEVLGTHFNVNAYPGDQILKTTLLEGAVNVKYHGQLVKMKPNQEVVLKKNIEKMVLRSVDTESAIAWKDGYFLFDNDNIQNVMDKISRWYDIEVIYKGEIPVQEFSGSISRSKPINEVLELLQFSNDVHFKLEGRRLTVMK